MLRTRLIVNPAAGAGKTAGRWPAIKQYLQNKGLKFDYDITEDRGHATHLAKTAVEKSYEQIVAVGGDGTINEVVNGLYDSGNMKDVTLGIIGTGTGGDFSHTLGIPRHWQQACETLLHPKRVIADLGKVELINNGQSKKRLFVNFAGLGFDAEIVRATTVRFKKLGGLPAYLAGLLTTLCNYRNRDIALKLDGKLQNRRVCTVVMSNGKYGGGSMFLAPNAKLDDGLFDVVIVGDVDKLDLLRSLPRIYRGTHLTHPKISVTRAREVEVQSTMPASIQADGELLGEAPARLSILPKAITILA